MSFVVVCGKMGQEEDVGEECVNCLVKLQGHQSLCFNIQALDQHPWHGPRKLGHASGASHSLLGARPLDPLVHTCLIPVLVLMFNPSFGAYL